MKATQSAPGMQRLSINVWFCEQVQTKWISSKVAPGAMLQLECGEPLQSMSKLQGSVKPRTPEIGKTHSVRLLSIDGHEELELLLKMDTFD